MRLRVMSDATGTSHIVPRVVAEWPPGIPLLAASIDSYPKRVLSRARPRTRDCIYRGDEAATRGCEYQHCGHNRHRLPLRSNSIE